MTTTTLQKILMAFIILAAAWFALRYRQSNYEPPESTVTVTPPPAIQGAPSGDQPAAIAPASAPEEPVVLPPVPKEYPKPTMGGDEDIGGIGSFNAIAGETMYDFDTSMSPPVIDQPQIPTSPPMEATGTEMYMAPPPEHGEIEMYTRSGYAEI